MAEPISDGLYDAIRLRDAETMQKYTTEITHSEFDRNALLAEVDRLRAELAAAIKAMLAAEFQCECGDIGAAWEALGDFHRRHGWTDPEKPCQPCTDLYGGVS